MDEPINVDLPTLPESERLSLCSMLDAEWKEKGYAIMDSGRDACDRMSALAERILDGSMGAVVNDPAGKGRGWTVTRQRSDARGPFEEWIGAFYPTYQEAEIALVDWGCDLLKQEWRAAVKGGAK